MAIKVTPQILRMIATTIAKSAFELDEAPELRWVHETVDRDYGDQLTEGEKKELINIIRLEHLNLETRVITSVVSKTLKYQKLTRERISIFNNPSPNHCYFWERYSKYKQSKPVLLQNTNRDTNRILEHMADPMSKDKFCSLGMVIGDVQAGKTGNYSALINKSADLGYKIVIVFTGVTENLRSQTQSRLDEDFVGTSSIAGQINQDRNLVGVGRVSKRRLELQPLPITDKNQDLRKASSATNVQSQATTSPIIIVTKKNATLLQYLLDWLKRQADKSGEGVDTPILIIDDEADNASVNTGKEDESPKAVNLGIREVISACNRVSYIAYTATPFANVFIDPESKSDSSGLVDLYPRDFIVALQAPSNYRGGKFFYYDEPDSDEDLITKQFISDAETYFPLSHKSRHDPAGLPPSLKRALKQFFIVCAIKDIRRAGQSAIKIDPDDKHDSCLINVSRFKAYQNSVRSLVDVEKNIILSGLQKNSEQPGSMLFSLRSEFESFFVKQKSVPEQWKQVKDALLSIGADQAVHPAVVSINSESPDDLVYPKEEQRRYIAIGGFKLGRGFTLEGLTISYFYRRSKMYDTLMQMARWFGYRDGYEDIVTLWTTKSAAGWYRSITEATEELKSDLVEFERQKIEPSEFGIRVRSHEVALIITAQNKMRTGTKIKGKTRFDNKLKETFFVDVRPEKQINNTEVSKTFLEKLTENYTLNYFNKKRTIGFFRDVTAKEVSDFLRSFDVFKGNSWSVHGLFLPFIERRAESEYSKWDVAFYLSELDETSSKSLVERFMTGQERNIRTLAAKSGLSENKFLSEKYAEHELPLGDHRKLGSGGFEGIGTPGMTSEEVAEKFRAKELSGKKCRELKSKNGGNPLLVIQMINIGFKYGDPNVDLDEDAESEMRRLEKIANSPYPTYSISLPPSREGHEGDDYIMTLNDAKNYFGELESDND
jgi:hypothetical protein